MSMKIARDLSVDNDLACGDFGIQLSGASYGQPSALEPRSDPELCRRSVNLLRS